MVRLDLGEVAVQLPRSLALQVLAQLQQQLDVPGGAPGDGAVRILDDAHPFWEVHSGSSAGYDDPEWSERDVRVAEAFYRSTKGKARVFLDLLIDHPGELLEPDTIIEARPDTFTSSYSVAGAINGLRLARDAAGRRFPFYWWQGPPARYAMKPSVAALFAAAREVAR